MNIKYFNVNSNVVLNNICASRGPSLKALQEREEGRKRPDVIVVQVLLSDPGYSYDPCNHDELTRTQCLQTELTCVHTGAGETLLSAIVNSKHLPAYLSCYGDERGEVTLTEQSQSCVPSQTKI